MLKVYIIFEEGRLSERGQSERRDMGKKIRTNIKLSSRLQRGKSE
jgi:hypothetical protein